MKFPNYIVFLYGKQRILHKSRIYGLLASLDMEKILYFLGVAEGKYNLVLLLQEHDQRGKDCVIVRVTV